MTRFNPIISKERPPMRSMLCGVTTLAVALAAGLPAYAGITVSTGYFDLTQAQFSLGLPAPDPWIGSPNTVFFGNPAQAGGLDPDEDAVLITNNGSQSVTLSALSIGSGTYNLFSVDGLSPPVTIAPGQNIIFAGVDGSDAAFAGPQVALTVDGNNITFNDPTGPGFAGGVLHGNGTFGSSDETVPWTVGFQSPNGATPEPSSFLLFGMVVTGLGVARWRKRKQAA